MSCITPSTTCRFCHSHVAFCRELVAIEGAPYCGSCGHRAWLECDCVKCRTPCVPRELTADDLREIDAELRRRRKVGA